MNNYFDDYEQEKKRKKATALPGWVWVSGIIGLILSIVFGYTLGRNTVLLIQMNTVADTNGELTVLNTLDFSDPLYVFSGVPGYNTIDSPMFYAMAYESNRSASDNFGSYNNSFSGSADFSVSFMNMNYYDVSCVIDFGSAVSFSYTFEPNLKSGNMEARLYLVSKKYQVEDDGSGFMKITSGSIFQLAEINSNRPESGTITPSEIVGPIGGEGYGYIVLVVGAESAYGSYNFSIKTYGVSE